jgi:signal peptidase I
MKRNRSKARSITFRFILFVVAYLILTTAIFTMRSLENESMLPGLRPGDRFIFLSFGIYHLAPEIPPFKELPLKRGSIVLIRPYAQKSFFFRAGDALVRFFTAGRLDASGGREREFIKRIIALPGDEVTIVNHVARVRPGGSDYTFTEFEAATNLEGGIGEPYEVNFPENNALWDETVPFSGTNERLILNDDECYVLSDDRSNTNDSRTWGAIPTSYISGKALVRYWPPNRLGKP